MEIRRLRAENAKLLEQREVLKKSLGILSEGKKEVRAYYSHSGEFGLRMAAMPRPLRIQYSGARYHVMSRGDRHEAIFYNDADRVEFLRTGGEAVE